MRIHFQISWPGLLLFSTLFISNLIKGYCGSYNIKSHNFSVVSSGQQQCLHHQHNDHSIMPLLKRSKSTILIICKIKNFLYIVYLSINILKINSFLFNLSDHTLCFDYNIFRNTFCLIVLKLLKFITYCGMNRLKYRILYT